MWTRWYIFAARLWETKTTIYGIQVVDRLSVLVIRKSIGVLYDYLCADCAEKKRGKLTVLGSERLFQEICLAAGKVLHQFVVSPGTSTFSQNNR